MVEVSAERSNLYSEFEYLSQEHRHHNWLIHGTWYLDIGFIAGAIRIYPELGDELVIGSIFSFFVFLGLGAYTYLQIKARFKIKKRKEQVASSLGIDYSTNARWKSKSKAIALLVVFYIIPLFCSLYVLCGEW